MLYAKIVAVLSQEVMKLCFLFKLVCVDILPGVAIRFHL